MPSAVSRPVNTDAPPPWWVPCRDCEMPFPQGRCEPCLYEREHGRIPVNPGAAWGLVKIVCGRGVHDLPRPVQAVG